MKINMVSSPRLLLSLLLVTSISTVQAWLPVSYYSSLRISSSLSSSSSSSSRNNNVILRPSDNPAAFDSFKVGNARVHRYSREPPKNNGPNSDIIVGGDSDTEYVMWYHGRSKEMTTTTTGSTAKLPPLSTGRIGRATSRNGLVWQKLVEGSASEDAPDVSLGLNKESWWGFDTAHVGLGNVLLPMSTPAVMTEGGIYIMYYMGGSFEETPLGDYMDVELPESARHAKIAGMKMKIGVAVSQDGISWGRVEGDDPSGACMVPYDKNNDPSTYSSSGDETMLPKDMPEELYCAWPEVVVDMDARKKSESFVMFYSTMTKVDKKKCIAYAVSEDGFRFYKRGLCLEPDDIDTADAAAGSSSLDAGGCARCTVVRDATYDADSATWKQDATGWTMYYEGISLVDKKHRILKATSKDLATWTKATDVALDEGQGDDAWDAYGVGSPNIVRMDDGAIRMYYTGQGKDGSTAIGVAKLSTASNEWVREQATFSFA